MTNEISKDDSSNINNCDTSNINKYLTKAKLKKKFMQDACNQMEKSESCNNEIKIYLQEIAHTQQKRLDIEKERLEVEKLRLALETKRLSIEENRANFFT